LGERRHGKGVTAPFNIAESLPMDTEQFGETFLSETGADSCRTDISPDDLQWIALRHATVSSGRKIVDIEYTPF
jgi:hypothetical protein